MITFRYYLPLEETLIFENVYPPELQMSLEEKEALKTPNSVWVWMYFGEQLIGEAYGVPLSELKEPIEGLSKSNSDNIMYCYSNTILPQYHKLGYGKILKAHWLGVVKGKGNVIVCGHARPNGSQELNSYFGAEFVHDFPNWYGTGETYKLYRLSL